MAKVNIKKSLPYVAAVIIFLILSFAYFPEVIQGKKLSQHDKKTFKGSSKEILDYKEKTGEHSLWTNSMFGGMPSYLISNDTPNNASKFVYNVSNLYGKLRPVNFLFFAMVGFFIALLLFGVDPWLSIIGAIAYGFSTYYLIIIEAGHLTKVSTMAFLPPIIAGIYYAYCKDKLKGSIVFMIFLSVQLYRNHLQITYYTLLIALIFIIFHFISSIRKSELKKFFVNSSFLLAATIIAVSMNFTNIITTYDYGKDSIRGKTELTFDKEKNTDGLDPAYVTDYSYSPVETLNLLIPNLMGGGSYSELSTDSETYKELKKVGAGNVKEIIKFMPTYWGNQRMTSGPVYIGAIMIFLFVFGLFIIKGNIKWWMLTATIIAILLAWGKNFMFLTELFLDYFPGYNKFRTVSMILIIAEFTIPLTALLALKEIFDKKVKTEDLLKALKWSAGIVSALILLLLINPGILSFSGENDLNTFRMMFGLQDDPASNNMVKSFVSALESDRASLFRADALRSLGFIIAAALTLWLFIKEKLKKPGFIAVLAILVLVDLWAVDKRYLNSDDFVSARFEKEPFKASNADKFIMKDVDPHFRVLNLSQGLGAVFNEANTSFFHKSIGGYHGAKMKRYQELITYAISNELNMLANSLSTATSELEIQSTLMNLSVINMLNTKYFIFNPEMMPMINQYNLGNAWFVNRIKEVENADQEIKAIQNFDPEQTAIIDRRFSDQFFKFRKDSSASIILTNYAPNKLSYKTDTKSDQLAVFSEIYYDKGWNAYIDGKTVPHMRVNYILRAMKVPAGKHEIVFKFEPSVWSWSVKIALIGSILFIAALLYWIWQAFKTRKKPEESVD